MDIRNIHNFVKSWIRISTIFGYFRIGFLELFFAIPNPINWWQGFLVVCFVRGLLLLALITKSQTYKSLLLEFYFLYILFLKNNIKSNLFAFEDAFFVLCDLWEWAIFSCLETTSHWKSLSYAHSFSLDRLKKVTSDIKISLIVLINIRNGNQQESVYLSNQKIITPLGLPIQENITKLPKNTWTHELAIKFKYNHIYYLKYSPPRCGL